MESIKVLSENFKNTTKKGKTKLYKLKYNPCGNNYIWPVKHSFTLNAQYTKYTQKSSLMLKDFSNNSVSGKAFLFPHLYLSKKKLHFMKSNFE